jgi:hypothetical protein
MSIHLGVEHTVYLLDTYKKQTKKKNVNPDSPIDLIPKVCPHIVARLSIDVD